MVEAGQVYRDTYFDKHDANKMHRTIKIVAIEGDKVRAETLTDCLGNPWNRKTRVSLKTLATGYVLYSV